MSQIIEAIKRIAITAEQKKYYNLPVEIFTINIAIALVKIEG